MSGQQRLLGRNRYKANSLILVPKLAHVTISFGEMRAKQEPVPSLEEKATMQPQNKYTYLHIQTRDSHMYPLISLP